MPKYSKLLSTMTDSATHIVPNLARVLPAHPVIRRQYKLRNDFEQYYPAYGPHIDFAPHSTNEGTALYLGWMGATREWREASKALRAKKGGGA